MSIQEASPLVSVVIPAYNAENFIIDAVDSILRQTYKRLEIIIIDDGSTDRTYERMLQLQARDNRVVIATQHNQGIAGALNAAIQLAKGDFIARMDADDISFPNRIEAQLHYLSEHPDVDMVSTAYIPFTDITSSHQPAVLHPEAHDQIYALLSFCSPICHPSALAKANVLKEFQYKRGAFAEDHQLWCRLIKKYKFANLKEPLLYYRRHGASATSKKSQLIRLSVVINGWKHILSDRVRYQKACQSLERVDRTQFKTINWKLFDVVQSIVRRLA